MDDKIELEIEISTMFSVNAHYRTKITVDRDEWEGMTENEREVYMSDEMDRVIAEQICADWRVVE